MKPHLSDDSDQENCDDPIKLFENDLDIVYFGSQPHRHGTSDTESWKFESIGIKEYSQPREHSTFGEPYDLAQMLQSGVTNECDISPVSVKLVDCGKFPWYFKKYTHQIMHKINLNKHSDIDHQGDEEGKVEDSDDCFIVEDLQEVTNEIITNNEICIDTEKIADPILNIHNTFNKYIGVVKSLKDDKEIQRALSIKNSVQVDFKRNRGLVGMKIAKKIKRNPTLDVKINIENKGKKTEAKQTGVNTALKTPSSINTQLIPITKEGERDLVGNNKTLFKSPGSQNVPVPFGVTKVSEEQIDNSNTKKEYDQSSESKLISKVSNKYVLNIPNNKMNIINDKVLNIANEKEISKLSFTEKKPKSSTKVTSHVKDMKKTNKYKNSQNKMKNSASHTCLVGVVVTKKNKEKNTKGIKHTKLKSCRDATQSKAPKLEKKPCKTIEKQKLEPNSPILHCSTVTKKLKQEINSKCNESDINSNRPSELGKLNQIVSKLSNLKSCNIAQDRNPSKHVIPKTATVSRPFEGNTKQALRKGLRMIDDRTINQNVGNTRAKSSTVSDQVKNFNEVGKTSYFYNNRTMSSSSHNKPFNQTQHENVNKHTINTALVRNPSFKAAIKSNNPTVCHSNGLTTHVVTPTSGSANQYANSTTTHGSPYPVNAAASTINNSSITNNNTNVQNRYASAIILKSNNHLNVPPKKYCEPSMQTMARQNPTNMSCYLQSPFTDPRPPYPIYYPPAYSASQDTHLSYFPSSVSSIPNQFHSQSPQGYRGQLPRNSMKEFYGECWSQNLVPPPPPPPPLIPPPNIFPRNCNNEIQSKDCSNLNYPSATVVQNLQSTSRQNSFHTVQTKNSSIIGMNNDGLVKKINIVAMSHNKNIRKETLNVEQIKYPQIINPVEDPAVVATKTEMLKELDKLSFVNEDINDFEIIYPPTIVDENKKENTLEEAIMSKKPETYDSRKLTMNQKDNLRQMKLANGYSPPILPIPTYQKVLDTVTTNSLAQTVTPKNGFHAGDPRSNLSNEAKPIKKRDLVKCCKRKLNNTWKSDEDSKRREDAKKISLEEYKQRLHKNDCKSKKEKNIGTGKYNNSGKKPNIEFKYRKNVDYSTETDLGYDSDSTVII